jgi:hypothetical protein
LQTLSDGLSKSKGYSRAAAEPVIAADAAWAAASGAVGGRERRAAAGAARKAVEA